MGIVDTTAAQDYRSYGERIKRQSKRFESMLEESGMNERKKEEFRDIFKWHGQAHHFRATAKAKMKTRNW